MLNNFLHRHLAHKEGKSKVKVGMSPSFLKLKQNKWLLQVKIPLKDKSRIENNCKLTVHVNVDGRAEWGRLVVVPRPAREF